MDGAVLVNGAVAHPECAFDELSAHTEQAGQDHPEGGSGPAQGDCSGDTGNIAEPHSRRDGRGQRLKVRNFAGSSSREYLPRITSSDVLNPVNWIALK